MYCLWFKHKHYMIFDIDIWFDFNEMFDEYL
jgi:hypothetical protein